MRRLLFFFIFAAVLACSVGAPAFAAMRHHAFMDICRYGTLKDIQAALRKGGKVLAKDDEGRTALLYASGSNADPEVITLLIKSGAVVNAKDPEGRTALSYAAGFNTNPEVVDRLLSSGAALDIPDKNGWTALMHAVKFQDNPEIVPHLIKAGADVNAVGTEGETPLLLAGSAKSIQALVQAGADVNRKGSGGKTVLAQVLDNSRYSRDSLAEMVSLLLGARADARIVDDHGSTALHHAAKNTGGADGGILCATARSQTRYER